MFETWFSFDCYPRPIDKTTDFFCINIIIKQFIYTSAIIITEQTYVKIYFKHGRHFQKLLVQIN